MGPDAPTVRSGDVGGLITSSVLFNCFLAFSLWPKLTVRLATLTRVGAGASLYSPLSLFLSLLTLVSSESLSVYRTVDSLSPGAFSWESSLLSSSLNLADKSDSEYLKVLIRVSVTPCLYSIYRLVVHSINCYYTE